MDSSASQRATERRIGQVITVGLGGMAISNRPGDVLIGHIVGPSVGTTIFDPIKRVGGMIHCLRLRGRIEANHAEATGLERLVKTLEEMGGSRENMRAKIAGNFDPAVDSKKQTGGMIYEAMQSALGQLNIEIGGESVGCARIRTVLFHMDQGRTEVRINSSRENALDI